MRLRYPLIVFTLLACTAVAYATSVRPLELEELVRQSNQIFVGRVVDMHHGTVAGTDFGYTEYTFAVNDWVKGGSARTVKVRQLARPFLIPGLPAYKKGQDVLLFLHRPSEIGLTSPVGMQQGYYPVIRAANGERVIRAGTMIPSVARLQAQAKGAAQPATREIPAGSLPLADFLALIRQIQ
ncbi:MAG TPA: hypothetical protein VGK99_15635 [Acidobacteriota bacterium]